MICRTLLCIIVFSTSLINFVNAQASLKSPDQFLPFKHGTRFTPHHLLVDYFQYVAESSDKVNLIEYGHSYELRPLIAAIISSPKNLNRLEEIRLNNLRRTGMLTGEPQKENIAIVHLSYSIHGNEASGSESAIAVLYALAKGGTDIDHWLENTIVIIDPALNPDGNSRYTNWNNSVSNNPNDPRPETREHQEPWPGGRSNHYYFDLNRDWVWMTQKETRDRIRFYLQWMPHVHADLHEMFGESSYYFAPAAQPYHPYLTTWQSDFQVHIGKNHASHFDKEGWRYFTKEFFDLFYPSYGDTYPMLSGAIGMTYEQSGHGLAGRAFLTVTGDTLQLSDRIAHHFTTSLSTIETASKNASTLVEEFTDYYQNANTKPTGIYKTYIISQSNPAGRIHDLRKLLDGQGIRYGVLAKNDRIIKALSYEDGLQANYAPLKGDLIIPVAQPRSVLLNVLFEQEAALADSLTYDITAWSIPMAYGLKAFATAELLPYEPYTAPPKNNLTTSASPYAYAIQWGSVPSARFLASLLHRGIIARYATEEFKVEGITFAAGTILLMKADNRKFTGFDDFIREVSMDEITPVTPIRTGFVEDGKDLGSDSYPLVRRPEVLTFTGNGVAGQSVGQVWHFFEEELQYPVHLVEIEDADNLQLDQYNVLVLPEGSYPLSKKFMDKLSNWTRSGGQVIALGSALHHFSGKEDFVLKVKNGAVLDSFHDVDLAHYPESYGAALRKSISDDITGAVFQTKIDKAHPLTFGLGGSYWTLKTGPASYAWLPSSGNAIYLEDKPKYFGFAGKKALDRINKSLVAGKEPMGSGGIVYLVDNPLFRSFWNSGKVLFSNALFFR